MASSADRRSCSAVPYDPAPSGASWRRRPDSNRRIRVLQTLALPLGYVAESSPPDLGPSAPRRQSAVSTGRELERETGFEPATPTLARLCSTTELFPLAARTIVAGPGTVKAAGCPVPAPERLRRRRGRRRSATRRGNDPAPRCRSGRGRRGDGARGTSGRRAAAGLACDGRPRSPRRRSRAGPAP